ncbi:hypothetical protein V5799_020773 [Amblyomma americanum]|uniref:Uncharacterized protein n=1 Tax=Amblyomma americanum TaxID=6943 RepID=A0AAQ4ET03_AMBAM
MRGLYMAADAALYFSGAMFHPAVKHVHLARDGLRPFPLSEFVLCGDVLHVYSECSCIATVREKDVLSVHGELTRCQTTFKALAPFSMGLFLALFETFLNSAPGMSATIRTIGEPTKPVALGLQWVSVRLFGKFFPFDLGGDCRVAGGTQAPSWRPSCLAPSSTAAA